MSAHFGLGIVFGVILLVACCHGWFGGRKYRGLVNKLVRGDYNLATDSVRKAHKREAEDYGSLKMSIRYMTVVGPVMIWIVWGVLMIAGFDTQFLGEFWYIGIFPPVLGCVYALAHGVLYDMWTRHNWNVGMWIAWIVLAVLGWPFGKILWGIVGVIASIYLTIEINDDRLDTPPKYSKPT